jgi:hypothetical protein
MMRFLENHDEPRAADTLGIERQVPAAALTLTLPGAMLLFDGQLTGSVVKLPVQLGRAPDEPQNEGLHLFYKKLLKDLQDPIYKEGEWRVLELMPAWDEYPTSYNLIAHGWQNPKTNEYRLTVVNLSKQHSQGIVRLDAWQNLAEYDWKVVDVVSDQQYDHSGSDLLWNGLLVSLGGNGFHVFRFDAMTVPLEDEAAEREGDMLNLDDAIRPVKGDKLKMAHQPTRTRRRNEPQNGTH